MIDARTECSRPNLLKVSGRETGGIDIGSSLGDATVHAAGLVNGSEEDDADGCEGLSEPSAILAWLRVHPPEDEVLPMPALVSSCTVS